MDIEKLITETFVAHEDDAPDSDTVLAAARRRIDRRGFVLSRPLVAAAGVAVLTLAAAAVVVLNRSGAAPDDQAQVGDGVQVSTGATEPAGIGLLMPYSLGWVPPGSVEYLVQRINIGGTAEDPDTPVYNGEYMFSATADGQVLNVDVQEMRMSPVDDAAFKSGPGTPVTINGRRGLESSRTEEPGGYELYVEHPDVGSMYVNVSAEHGSTASAQQLVDVGRRIAENLQFPGTTTVTPAFGLRDLPNGMRICAFDVEKGLGRPEAITSYSLGATCATQPPVHIGTTTANWATGTPVRPVQGHATRYADEDGHHKLWVLDAVNDDPILIAGSVPPTDLYDIANQLVLPS